MNKKELLELLAEKPDDFEIKFSSEGYTYEVGTVYALPEWKYIYLGVDKEELAESLMTEMEHDAEEDYDPPTHEQMIARDAFLEALEHELEGDPAASNEVDCCAIEGGCPTGVVVKRFKDENPNLGVM